MSRQISDDAVEAANRQVERYCTTCPRMCRFACPVAHVEARETVTPWGLVSLLHLTRAGSVELDAEVAEVLGHCTGCLGCQSACLHGNHVPRVIFDARHRARSQGLLDDALPTSRISARVNDGAALGFVAGAPLAFFSESDDDAELRRIARLLSAFGVRARLVAGGGSAASGYPLLAAGALEAYEAHVEALTGAWGALEGLITDSDGLLALLSTDGWSEPWTTRGVTSARHWSQALAERLADAPAATPPRLDGRRLVYHDACKLGRGAGVYDAPRALLDWAHGEDARVELEDHEAQALCCGQGAGYAAREPVAARALAAGIGRDAERVGAAVVVSASGGCLGHLAGSNDAVEVWSLAQALIRDEEG